MSESPESVQELHLVYDEDDVLDLLISVGEKTGKRELIL